MRNFTFAVVLVGSAGLLALLGREEVRILTFESPAVDGVDHLVLRGTEAVIEHQEWQPIVTRTLRVLREFPRDGKHVAEIRNRQGRADVQVLEQPSAANDFTLRVLLDDGPHAGDTPVSFEVFAVPATLAPRPHNVVVVTIDTLRPDHLGCYGYARPTSPNLDWFREQCVLFRRAYSTSSFTPPSHASLFTSQYVAEHGLRTWNPLDPAATTLAEILESCHYRTGAFVSIDLLGSQNLGQGFATRSEGYDDGMEVVRDGLRFLRQPSDRPFFLWLHFYDVHRPYGRHWGWPERFGKSPSPGLGDGEEHYNLTAEEVAQQGLGDEELAFLVDRYDAGIAYVDAALGPLLRELSLPVHRANTFVVLTADHGENLLEHRERVFTHDPFLYDSVTRIPLFLRYPGGAAGGATSDELVSLIDLAPTVLELLGLEPPATFRGMSLLPLLLDVEWPRDRIYHECWGWEERKAVRTRESLVLWDREQDGVQFFDLLQDPAEMHPRVRARGPREEELQRALESFLQQEGALEPPPPLDPEVIERLRELGYVDDDG